MCVFNFKIHFYLSNVFVIIKRFFVFKTLNCPKILYYILLFYVDMFVCAAVITTEYPLSPWTDDKLTPSLSATMTWDTSFNSWHL